MTRECVPLYIDDISGFAKALRAELARAPAPGHQAMLAILARSAGFGNYQHLRAERPVPQPSAQVQKALRVFDERGRMMRWPSQTAVQGLCLWVLWARMAPARDYAEPEINAILKEGSGFGDHVLMRRSLIDHRLVSRDARGRAYRRIEQVPPADALAVIRGVG